ncbi:glycosyltransferase family 61 protein [Vibrio genomosp. F10 str. 9ZC157]|uniref:Capsular biosynthesis protein n=1 Tax=Vibrio genomosp. F10 str. ZF-129 TaxID=1187848 RepID=A0A1E5BEC4_9VIBR|nr:glycosyltransferase family 61 protein [Vibrio genomosp. F10]OEE33129.1 capsular biosynthesis protein [Vibrio genomosp. F10 str. ZF-129]OEE95630.1 capsular biosynthesis protein [Vibrio genomosp. F10 str. 9ZC157]
MKKLISITLRSIYYLFPKIFREQYIESIAFYRTCLSNLVCRDNNNSDNLLDVQLVSEPNLLDDNFELIAHITDRYSKVNAPRLHVDNQECKRSPLEGQLPDVKVIRLSGVNILGSTDAIISGNKMYHQELTLMGATHDLKRPDIFSTSDGINAESRQYIVQTYGDKLTVEGCAISLLKEHSVNYYHWLTELLPKLVETINSLDENNHNLTILIDEKMPEQCVGLIDLILKGIRRIKYTIVRVKLGQLVFCHKLIYCTPLWTSLDNTRFLPNPKKEFFVSVDCLRLVKERISLAIKSNTTIIKNKKVYLQRQNNKLRKITNVLELERMLYKQGFDFVDPGSLDFREQYSLFSQAEIIVGASGASFTNLLFMKDGSKGISLYPSAQSTNYYVFQPLADVSNVEFIHFLTTPDDDSNSVHGDAKVNVKELEGLLEKTYD